MQIKTLGFILVLVQKYVFLLLLRGSSFCFYGFKTKYLDEH